MNVALVGCGGMAAHYLSVYNDLEWVKVVACVDSHLPHAEKAALAFASKPQSTTSFEAALNGDVDAVVISTPNGRHAPQGIAAIEAGKHVLLQKPIAATVAEAEAIERAAAESPRTTGLYMSYFDQPLIHDLRDLVRQGRLGSVAHCYARLMHRGGMMWSREALGGRPTWRGALTETGGGCFIQLAVHYIHIFEWVTGARVIKVTAMKTNLHCPGLEGEDLACAILQLDSGALITLDTAWCADGEELSIHGTGGRAQYRANRYLSLASDSGPFEGRVARYSGASVTQAFGGPVGAEEHDEVIPPAFGDAANPLNQHRQFLEAARAGVAAPVSIASGVWDLRVVQAVYDSAARGREVVLS